MAQEEPLFRDGSEAELATFRWDARPVIVFGAEPASRDYARQMDMLRAAEPGLRERDIVVLGDVGSGSDSALRQRFTPAGFLIVLVGKDGGVKLSRASPVSAETLFETIDAMPMRRREMRAE